MATVRGSVGGGPAARRCLGSRYRQPHREPFGRPRDPASGRSRRRLSAARRPSRHDLAPRWPAPSRARRRAELLGDPPHGFLELLALLEDPQVVAVGLAHLLAVEAGHLRHVVPRRQPGLGAHEDVPEAAVEVGRHVLGHLDVLDLVLAHRHHGGVVGEDVRGHEDRVGEQPDGGLDAVGELVLVRVRALEQPHAGHGGQQPGDLGHLRHVALPEEDRPPGVHPQGEVGRRQLPDVRAQFLRVVDRRQRVVVRDEEEVLAGLLEGGDVLADGAEVVAEMGSAAGLDPREEGRRGGLGGRRVLGLSAGHGGPTMPGAAAESSGGKRKSEPIARNPPRASRRDP